MIGRKKSADTDAAATRSFGPLAAVVVTLTAFLGSQLLAISALGLGAGLFGRTSEQVINDLEKSVGIQFIYILIAQAITIGILWIFLKSRNVGWSTIGLGRKPNSKDIGPALAVAAVYFTALIIVTSLVSSFVTSIDTEQEQQLGFEGARTEIELLFVFISLVILPPIVEEILVRGFMYTGLRRKFKKITAGLIASLFFGALHLQLGFGAPPLWIAAIDTALLSGFLIYLREKTDALWAGMLVHALKNGIAFIFLFIVGSS